MYLQRYTRQVTRESTPAQLVPRPTWIMGVSSKKRDLASGSPLSVASAHMIGPLMGFEAGISVVFKERYFLVTAIANHMDTIGSLCYAERTPLFLRVFSRTHYVNRSRRYSCFCRLNLTNSDVGGHNANKTSTSLASVFLFPGDLPK